MTLPEPFQPPARCLPRWTASVLAVVGATELRQGGSGDRRAEGIRGDLRPRPAHGPALRPRALGRIMSASACRSPRQPRGRLRHPRRADGGVLIGSSATCSTTPPTWSWCRATSTRRWARRSPRRSCPGGRTHRVGAPLARLGHARGGEPRGHRPDLRLLLCTSQDASRTWPPRGSPATASNWSGTR